MRQQIIWAFIALAVVRMGFRLTRLLTRAPSSTSSHHSQSAADVIDVAGIGERFPAMASDERGVALGTLVSSEEPSATKLWVSLIPALHDEELQSVLQAMVLMPHHPALVLPAVLPLADRGVDLAVQVDALTLAFAEQGKLSQALMHEQRGHWDARYHALRIEAKKRDVSPASFWEPAYQNARHDAAVLLHLFGFLPRDWFAEEVADALQFRDTELASFALRTTLVRNLEPSADLIQRIASVPYARPTLLAILSDQDRADLILLADPTPLSLAEGRLSNWLTHPSELGRPPDALEFVESLELAEKEDGKPQNFWVFRFKSSKFAERGWMAGISALNDDADYDLTFSSFIPMDDKAPRGHVEEALQMFRSMKEQQLSANDA